MKVIKVKDIVLLAFFAALSAVLSQVMIPIGPVPINFTHVSIFTAAGLLGAKRGAISQTIFVLLGAVGAPVFSEFMGGIGILAGPTGGFVVGYIVCALVTGLIIDRFGKSFLALMSAMYLGWLVTYLCGIPWLMFVLKTGLAESLTMFVVPFLLGDLIKTVLSAVVINRLGPVLEKGRE